MSNITLPCDIFVSPPPVLGVASFLDSAHALSMLGCVSKMLNSLVKSADGLWEALAKSFDDTDEETTRGRALFEQQFQRRMDRILNSDDVRSLLRCHFLKPPALRQLRVESDGYLWRQLVENDLSQAFNYHTLLLEPGVYELTKTLEIPLALNICAAQKGTVILKCTRYGTTALRFQAGGRLANIELLSDGPGIIVYEGDLSVEGCTIYCDDDGIEVGHLASAHVLQSTITAKRCGVTLSNGCVESCELLDFDGCGIEIGMGHVDALRCRISGRRGYGLQYSCGATGLVADCTFTTEHMTNRGDILAAVLVESGSDPVVRRNVVTGPFRNGVYCCDAGKGSFVGNVFEGFTRFAVVLMSKAEPSIEGNLLFASGARGSFAAPDRNDATAANMLGAMQDANTVLYSTRGWITIEKSAPGWVRRTLGRQQ
jgi:hypothetical protein